MTTQHGGVTEAVLGQQGRHQDLLAPRTSDQAMQAGDQAGVVAAGKAVEVHSGDYTVSTGRHMTESSRHSERPGQCDSVTV